MTRGGGSCPQAAALGVPDDARCHARTHHACTLGATHEGAHLCACGSGWGSGGGVPAPAHGTKARYEGSRVRPPCRCPECLTAGMVARRTRDPGRYASSPDQAPVPASEVAELVQELIAAGWAISPMARASGIDDTTIRELMTGRRRTAWRRTYDALAALRGREPLQGPAPYRPRPERTHRLRLWEVTPQRLWSVLWLKPPSREWWEQAACAQAVRDGRAAEDEANRAVAVAQEAVQRAEAAGEDATSARAVAAEAVRRREVMRPTWATLRSDIGDWWNSTDPAQRERALRICHTCPVSDDCFAAELIERADSGYPPQPTDVSIRGGRTPEQLARAWRAVAVRKRPEVAA